MSVPLDTSPAARRRQIQAVRAIPPAERLRIADEMSAEVRALAEAGIRRRHPDALPETVAQLLAERLLGRDLAVRARDARFVVAR
jgi:hypothetical protein